MLTTCGPYFMAFCVSPRAEHAWHTQGTCIFISLSELMTGVVLCFLCEAECFCVGLRIWEKGKKKRGGVHSTLEGGLVPVIQFGGHESKNRSTCPLRNNLMKAQSSSPK